LVRVGQTFFCRTPELDGIDVETTLAVDGDAIAFWREFCRALLPRLGWSDTVSEPTVSLGPPTGRQVRADDAWVLHVG